MENFKSTIVFSIIILVFILLPNFCYCDNIPSLPNCGRFNKITNGTKYTTGLGEFPWNVILEYESENANEQILFCNGVLISNRFVLTIARCAETIFGEVIAVHIGRQNMKNNTDCHENVCALPYQRIEIDEIIIHIELSSRRRMTDNRIALLRLKNDVVLNSFIAPVCLPFALPIFSEFQNGHSMVISGWGNTESIQGEISDEKQKIDMMYINRTECQKKCMFCNPISNLHFCTIPKTEEADICQYFGGSPVVQNIDEFWVLQGIVSFGIGCRRYSFTGCIRISEYKDWIISKVNMGLSKILSTGELLPVENQCGQSQASSIIRGTLTGLHEYPWTVLLEKNGENLCSGFLINRQYVLTSAKCAQNGITHIVAGEYDTAKDIDCAMDSDEMICNDRIQKEEVQQIIIHEKYSRRGNSLLNNIAIIRLKQKVFLTDSVFPICMPSSVAAFTASTEPQTLTVTGWGNTEAFGEVPTKKQKVLLVFINSTECASRLQDYRFSPSNSLLCAGLSSRIHVCNEFSGSVLMKEVAGSWVAEGIFSGTFGCRPETPGIYTKLIYYEPWILRKLSQLGE